MMDITAIEDADIEHNTPTLWQSAFPRLDAQGHKYDRGHAVIFAGGLTGTGAARLAARAALHAGAGLVTIGAPGSALIAHAGRAPDALMVRKAEGAEGIKALLEDERINATCIGPAYGVNEDTVDAAQALLSSGRHVLLDADIFGSFENNAVELAKMLYSSAGDAVLTPHEGEFVKLFGHKFDDLPRSARALQAAEYLNSTVVLKGHETLIASPDGRTARNTNAPPTLATAGAGDVLSGIITGLLAQGMPPFEAACAGVWLHSEAADAIGPGLIADDLPPALRGPLAMVRKAETTTIGFGQ